MKKTIKISKRIYEMMKDAEYAPMKYFYKRYPHRKVTKEIIYSDKHHSIGLIIHGPYIEDNDICGGYNHILLINAEGEEDRQTVYIDTNIQNGKNIKLTSEDGKEYDIVLSVEKESNSFLSRLRNLF